MGEEKYSCTGCILGKKANINADDHGEGIELDFKKFLISTTIAGTILAFGILNMFMGRNLYAFLSFLIVLILSGSRVLVKAIEELIHEKAFSIELLVIVAAIGAFLIGEFAEGAIVVFLFSIAAFLEDYASERAKKSIEALLKERPTRARILKDNTELEVNVEDVNPGDVIIVRPGEKIPLDGIVVKGSASVNEAPLTGESIPIEKSVGDKVRAGTICMDGVLIVKVERRAHETILARVIELVKLARKEKSDIERFVEKFSKYYTPAILSLALIVITVFPLILGDSLYQWVYRALTLLVISCPCALAISIPVAMVSGLVGSARNGVLVKGGKYLEHLTKTNIIAFDKTGTLTKGRLQLTKIIPVKINAIKLLQIATSLSLLSKHPIANAIVDKAKELNIKPLDASDFKSIPGKGVYAKIDNKTYFMGNDKFIEELGIPIPKDVIMNLESEGNMVVLIADEEKVLGVLGFEDELRKEAIDIIKELKRRGLKVVMLTGDREVVARRIANKLGIEKFYAELLPEDKVEVIENLMEGHKRHVVMVGDGINDAPALARACVGIAMGTGTEVVIETGDVVLMRPNLRKIVYLIDLSRRTINVIKQNVSASILIKSSLALLALMGMVKLWVAVLVGDAGLSLAVVLNAMRLTDK